VKAINDDMRPPDDGRVTKTLEIYVQAWQIAEALAVGRAFARALGSSSQTTLNFLFYVRFFPFRGLTPNFAFRGQMDGQLTLFPFRPFGLLLDNGT
jgi:hypothetical protein